MMKIFDEDIDLELFEDQGIITDIDMVNIKEALSNDDISLLIESDENKNNDRYKISQNGNMVCFDIDGHNYSIANYIIEQCDGMGIRMYGDMDNKSIRIRTLNKPTTIE